MSPSVVSTKNSFFGLWIVLLFATLCLPVRGLEIWDGPLLLFNHPDGVGTNVQDQMTAQVAITRETTQGLINAVAESGYTHNLSPADTEWSYGVLADYASLSYTDWESWAQTRPPSTVGRDAVLHLISDDIYLSIRFQSWGGPGGAYSYERSTQIVPEPSAAALILLTGGGMALRHVGRRPASRMDGK